MVSFLKKLRGEGISNKAVTTKPEAGDDGLGSNSQKLNLDVYQTDKEIVIYAPIYGSKIDDVDVGIEGDNDVVTIQGKRARPEQTAFEGKKTAPSGQFYAEEIEWGNFYRQIILPHEIDVERAEAKLKNGILIMVLPLVGVGSSNTTKMKILELDEE